MDYKDYYGILGVSKGASRDEIQRAYRKLARKYHPDINKSAAAESRFKEINEAYEVLRDKEKRAKYDRFGSAWKQAQRTGAPPPGFEEIFSQFGFGPGGFRGGRQTRVDFDLGGGGFSSFFEMLFGSPPGGGATRVEWGGPGMRAGRGSLDHEARIALPLEAAGRGGKREIQLTDPASGRKRTLRVNIPRGIRPGQKIRLAGQGGEAPGGGARGDLYLTIDLLPHPNFRLQGSDLHTQVPVAPWEAVLGGTASVHTLDGPVTVRIPPGSSSGRRIRLRGRGFPTANGRNGDLFAEIRIMVPEQVSDEDRKLFEELARTSKFDPRA